METNVFAVSIYGPSEVVHVSRCSYCRALQARFAMVDSFPTRTIRVAIAAFGPKNVPQLELTKSPLVVYCR